MQLLVRSTYIFLFYCIVKMSILKCNPTTILVYLSLYRFFANFHSSSVCLSLSLSNSLSHTHTHTLSHSLSLPFSLSLSLSLSNSFPHSLTHSPSPIILSSYLFFSIYSFLSIPFYLFLSIYSFLSISFYLFLSIYFFLFFKSDEDDEAAFSASQCLDTIGGVLDAVQEHGETMAQLEILVMPLLERCIYMLASHRFVINIIQLC